MLFIVSSMHSSNSMLLDKYRLSNKAVTPNLNVAGVAKNGGICNL